MSEETINPKRRTLLKGALTLGAGAGLAACGRSSPLATADAATPGTSGSYSADVAIVGAGIAGLSAARRLAAAGKSVYVVEARDRVGGRTLNHAVTAPGASPGTIVEIGGQWVGPTQDRVLALIDELGLKTFKTYDDGNYLDYRNGQKLAYGHLLPDPLNLGLNRLPPTDPVGAAEAEKAILQLDQMAQQVPLDAPWTAASAKAWDSMTFQTWIDQNVLTPGGQSLITLAIESVFSVEPRDTSLLHVLFYIASAGTLENLINTAGGAQDSRVVGGSQRISLAMAAQLGNRVLLGAPVTHIDQDESGVTVRGEQFSVRARQVIVAVPPTIAARIRYNPILPALRDQMTQRMPMGSVIKVQCVYPKPFWRDGGYNGQVTSDTGPVRITFDNSPPDASVGILLGFMEGSDGRAASTLTADQRRQATIDCFVRYFGNDAAQPLDYIEQSWMNEEWTRGCYGGVFAPGAWLDFGAALRAPVGRIHWAGTETATVWNGYMDGAVRSGEAAASAVAALL
ncbi:MAG: flavin monoamine oxidase family protein [Nevskiaceae bacterium]|nr:MAG: flavin monoamine oxidase family protein [Nevskiaceae bacterium]